MKIYLAIIAMAGILSYANNTDTLELPTKEENRYSIESFNWLVGHWKGNHFNGIGEEIWTAPVDGVMMGMYRYSEKGKNGFYEFCHLGEFEDGIELRIKHFNPDMSGWEEKTKYVTFKLNEITDNKMIFDGLTMELKSPNSLEMLLDINHGKDSIVTHTLSLNRVSNSGLNLMSDNH